MNFFIFNFDKHSNYIDSFLSSASLAHRQERKKREWFYWKFRDNPFGGAILACSEDGGNIIGSVAFGMQDLVCDEKLIKGALSFATFVHPEYQGRGLFKKLITLAETEAKLRGVRLLLNFPNSNSLPGFLGSGWTQINNIEYWIKPRGYNNLLFNFNDLRKAFKPNDSNIEKLNHEAFTQYRQNNTSGFFFKIDAKYLNWRFLSFPNAEYIVIDDENNFSVGRVGRRGKLAEIQVLFVTPIKNEYFSLQNTLEAYAEKIKYDLISLPISKKNRLRPYLKQNMFIKVPNNTNICYKILDTSLRVQMDSVELSAINFHTY